MPRGRSVFACTECGAQQPRWLGRCPECGGWSTLVEERAEAPAELRELIAREPHGAKPRRLAEIDADAVPRLASGIAELDRVLGGGLVPGSVVLLAGEPGVGKSTLALQLAAGIRSGRPVLYVAGEESPEQIRLRAPRLVARIARRAGRDVRRGVGGPMARDPAGASAGRLGADAAQRARRVGAGLGGAGARVRGAARGHGEGARHGARARRTRHQGG